MQAFLQDDSGNLIDRDGVKRFEHRQFAQYGGLMPKLYTYSGKRFDIHEVMGVLDRDPDGKLIFLRSENEHGKGAVIDQGGNLVNNKGYIVNDRGDICSRQGPVLFAKETLRNGEFPKFFPFSRFNIKTVMGEFEIDPQGVPILERKPNGTLVDKQGKTVNSMGFTIDAQGNVIDDRGYVHFEQSLLGEGGDIPELFKANLLRSEEDSSISQLMDEMENRPMSEEDNAAVDMGRESAMAARQAAQLAKQADAQSFDSDVRAQNNANRQPIMSPRLAEDI